MTMKDNSKNEHLFAKKNTFTYEKEWIRNNRIWHTIFTPNRIKHMVKLDAIEMQCR